MVVRSASSLVAMIEASHLSGEPIKGSTKASMDPSLDPVNDSGDTSKALLPVDGLTAVIAPSADTYKFVGESQKEQGIAHSEQIIAHSEQRQLINPQ